MKAWIGVVAEKDRLEMFLNWRDILLGGSLNAMRHLWEVESGNDALRDFLKTKTYISLT